MIPVREARPSDAEAIAAIHVRTWQCAYRGMMPDNFLDSLSVGKRLAQRIRILSNPSPAHRTFVAEVEGEIAGFCDIGPRRESDQGNEPDGAVGELAALYVAPERARTGVGTALMDRALASLRAEGFRLALLWVLADNLSARHFYEKTGWTTDGTSKIEDEGTFILKEIRYTKQLE